MTTVTTPITLLHLRSLALKSPDPAGAGAIIERFVEAGVARGIALPALVPDEDAATLLVLLAGQSPALARRLVQDPSRLARLAGDAWLAREKPESVMREELAALVAGGFTDEALREGVQDEMLRLGARELGHGRPEEVLRELAHLAGAALDVALEALAAELEARHGVPRREDGARVGFVVFGMGKLGGEELNFSSDIDLIYAYETDAGAAGEASLHEHFARLAERLTRALGECFRVDLRLRPEGTRGTLVNSLPALERYYESFGRAWERQAWIKARPVAGDRALGEEILRTLAPFVWPRSGSARSVDAVREMVNLLDEARAGAVAGDLKLGRGGIREIEFFVQALQLIHGGRQPALRARGTLAALEKLLFAGLVSEHEHRTLGDAYLFLRRVEHRLQLDELLQTHALPEGEVARSLLARRLGLPDAPALERLLDTWRDAVSALFATLTGGVREHAPLPQHVRALLDRETSNTEERRALTALGVRDLEMAHESLVALRRRPRTPFSLSASEAESEAAAALLVEVEHSPDPDLALARLADLAARGVAAAGAWRLVTAHRPVARLLVSLLGTSDFLARLLLTRPDLVEPLLATPRVRPTRAPDRAEHAATLAARLLPLPADDEELRLDEIRRWRNEELLRVGLADIAGELDVEHVSAELSALAEASLAAVLEVVRAPLARRYGRDIRLAVVALGKLGAREMSYSSDLDLLFVFEEEKDFVSDRHDPIDPFEHASRLAQRLLRGLGAYLREGRLYEVDARLRPSGRMGALVSSLEGFRRYHENDAALWERQALLKARTVAGDGALATTVDALLAQVAFGGAPLDARAAAGEIARLRARMEKELAHEAPERGHYHIKAGRGGIVDIEFLVQYLQLVHGPRAPLLRARATRPALDALRLAGLLSDEDHAQLAAAYTFLRRLENRMRIVYDRPLAELPGAAELDKLARRMGWREADPGAHLLAEYRAHTEAVRAIHARFLPAAE